MKTAGYIYSERNHEIDREIELKIQLERIKEFCVRNNLDLTKVYHEPFSDREDYKPILLRLIKDASVGEYSRLVILRPDVFGSDKMVQNWAVEELTKNDIRIYTLIEDKSQNASAKLSAQAKGKSIKEKVRDIPSLPEVVTKVTELVQNHNSSAAQLSRVISHDPGLTTRVLRLVNSAYYGFPKQISSIQHAIMILGFTTIRGLVLSSSIFKIFAPKNSASLVFNYKEFWKHSLLTAIAAKKLNSHLYLNLDENIFSAAILHDIGKVILDQYDHENFTLAYSKITDHMNFPKILETEQKYCDINHCQIGHMVAEGWNLPYNITEVILYHHNPLEAKENKTLVSLVSVANMLAHQALENRTFDIKLYNQDVLDYLKLDTDDIETLNVSLVEELDKISDFEAFFK